MRIGTICACSHRLRHGRNEARRPYHAIVLRGGFLASQPLRSITDATRRRGLGREIHVRQSKLDTESRNAGGLTDAACATGIAWIAAQKELAIPIAGPFFYVHAACGCGIQGAMGFFRFLLVSIETWEPGSGTVAE